MAPEANVLINIEGKPFMLSKHLKKSNLIEIITKLQEDLTQIKEYTKKQINYKTELAKVTLENKKLQESLSEVNNDNEAQNETNTKVDEFEELSEARKKLKESYEKKAFNTTQLYEEKIDLLRKQIVEIEKDRKSYAETIEKKQNTIKGLKQDFERFKKENNELEQYHNKAIRDLKHKADNEKLQIEQDKQKLIKDKEVLQKTYIELDKIRKYLEKSNASMKSSMMDANRVADERIKKLTKNYEEKEKMHLNEIKRLRRNVEAVVQEAEAKIERIEDKLAKSNEKYQIKVNEVSQENEHFKAMVRNYEQNEQNLKSELTMYRNLVEQTRCFYEDSIRALNGKFHIEKDKIDQEMGELKSNYEIKINELKSGKEMIEGDTNLKVKQINQLQSENKFMSEKIIEMRLKSEEYNKKYLSNYNLLKDKVEIMRKNYDTDKFDLKTELSSRDKTIDDLNVEKKNLEKQIKSLKCSNELLKQENERDLNKIWQKIENQKETYTEELQKLKESHTQKMKLFDNDLQQSKFDYEVLDTHYNELLTNKQNLDKTCQKLRLQLSEIEDEHRKELSQVKKDFLEDERSFTQDYDTLNHELLKQIKTSQNFENEMTKLKTQKDELEGTIQLLEVKNNEEIERLKQLIDENTNDYKEDLQNMKQLLSYKEEMIRKLEEKLNEQELNHNLAITDKQDKIKSIETNNEIIVNDIKKNFEIQKQKYDILIYEFYRELKEQQIQTDTLTKIKADLEEENSNLKKQNGDKIIGLTKQKEIFQHNSALVKQLEFL